jgi:hypothetical protein
MPESGIESKSDFMAKEGTVIFFGDGSLLLHPALSQTFFEPDQQLLLLPSYAFEETNYFIEYKGDWALRKGDDLANAPIASSAPARSGPGIGSVQRLISEDIVQGKSVMVFETDLSDPALHHMIAGHVMNGVALCPAVSSPRIKILELMTNSK